MRTTWIGIGLATLGLVWLSPLRELAPGPFSAHMIMHMGVVAVAAPALAFGLAGSRFDPVLRAPRWFAPIPASLVELVAVWSWHAPGLHHFARHSALGTVLEQATFLASGFLVWMAAFGGEPGARGERIASGGLAMLLTSMHMTLLGALLALPPRPLYASAAHGGGVLAPIDDQHLGGAIMLVAGGLAYLGGGLALTIELLRSRSAREGYTR